MVFGLEEKVYPTSAYVAGGMTGLPSRQFQVFDGVTLAARALGIDIHSPAEEDRIALEAAGFDLIDVPGFAENGGDIEGLLGITYEQFMATDFIAICQRKAIIMLPKWEQSSGARSERFVAEMTGSEVWLAFWSYSGWHLYLDDVQRRMTSPTVQAA